MYLATTLLVMLGGQLAVLVVDTPWDGAVRPRLWDNPLQGAVAALTCAAALLCLTVRRRMKGVVLAGLTGYGTALLFVVQGAPDLALTQFCMETVAMIVFVLVLRRMPVHFRETVSTWRRAVRIPVALAAAATVGVGMWVAAAARTAEPAGAAMVQEVADHGLKDVVATILVDLRAWDTMGESAVLAAAAIGVTSLIYLHRRSEGSMAQEELQGRTAWSLSAHHSSRLPRGDDAAPERGWLAAGATSPRTPLGRLRSGGPTAVPPDPGALGLPAVLRRVPARRRLLSPGSSPGRADHPLPGGRPFRTRRGGPPCSPVSSPDSDSSSPPGWAFSDSVRAPSCTPSPTTGTCRSSATTT